MIQIIKYEQKNNKYKIIFESKEPLTVYEEVIINNHLLYKKEINEELYQHLLDENYYYSAEVTDRYTFTSDVTLYAKWDKQAESYIIWIALAFVAVTIIAFSCWLAFARPKMHE